MLTKFLECKLATVRATDVDSIVPLVICYGVKFIYNKYFLISIISLEAVINNENCTVRHHRYHLFDEVY